MDSDEESAVSVEVDFSDDDAPCQLEGQEPPLDVREVQVPVSLSSPDGSPSHSLRVKLTDCKSLSPRSPAGLYERVHGITNSEEACNSGSPTHSEPVRKSPIAAGNDGLTEIIRRAAEAAVRIQRVARGYLARREADARREALWKEGFSLLVASSEHMATVVIQSAYRGCRGRQSVQRLRKHIAMVKLIQAGWRKYRAIEHLIQTGNQSAWAVLEIQRCFRGYVGRKKMFCRSAKHPARMKHAQTRGTPVMALNASMSERSRFIAESVAATWMKKCVQPFCRMLCANQRNAAALRIQCHCRKWLAHLHLGKMALRIQRIWRGWEARGRMMLVLEFRRMKRDAAIRLQRFFRRHRLYLRYKRYRRRQDARPHQKEILENDVEMAASDANPGLTASPGCRKLHRLSRTQWHVRRNLDVEQCSAVYRRTRRARRPAPSDPNVVEVHHVHHHQQIHHFDNVVTEIREHWDPNEIPQMPPHAMSLPSLSAPGMQFAQRTVLPETVRTRLGQESYCHDSRGACQQESGLSSKSRSEAPQRNVALPPIQRAQIKRASAAYGQGSAAFLGCRSLVSSLKPSWEDTGPLPPISGLKRRKWASTSSLPSLAKSVPAPPHRRFADFKLR